MQKSLPVATFKVVKMINKYSIIALWFICSVVIITGCRRNDKSSIIVPTPIPVNTITPTTPVHTITLTPIKDYVFVKEWRFDSDIELLNFTMDIDGNFIMTGHHNKVYKYNSQGKFISKWIWDGSILATNDQNIYALCNEIGFRDGCEFIKSSTIKKYDLNGKFITSWESNYIVAYITVDKEGNVYLCVYGLVPSYLPMKPVFDAVNNIEKYDSNGNLKSTYKNITEHIAKDACRLSRDPLQGYISDIKVSSSGYIYVVAGLGNSLHNFLCIATFNSSGKYIKQWDKEYSKYKNMCWSSLVIDSEDNIYIADVNEKKNTYIHKFDSNGNFITKWNVNDDENRCFGSMLVGSQGELYILFTDKKGSIIKKYAPVLNKTK